MGGRQRYRPKSIYLLILQQDHRAALTADWLARYNRTWQPITYDTWLDAPKSHKPVSNIAYGTAWALTRELLRDRTSNSYAALVGYAYIPTGAETALWDQYELEGRLKQKGFRPWLSKHNDPFSEPKTESRETHERRVEQRRRINELFHIDD